MWVQERRSSSVLEERHSGCQYLFAISLFDLSMTRRMSWIPCNMFLVEKKKTKTNQNKKLLLFLWPHRDRKELLGMAVLLARAAALGIWGSLHAWAWGSLCHLFWGKLAKSGEGLSSCMPAVLWPAGPECWGSWTGKRRENKSSIESNRSTVFLLLCWASTAS